MVSDDGQTVGVDHEAAVAETNERDDDVCRVELCATEDVDGIVFVGDGEASLIAEKFDHLIVGGTFTGVMQRTVHFMRGDAETEKEGHHVVFAATDCAREWIGGQMMIV